MLARAVVRMITDSGGRQTAQVEATKGELISGMERMQEYGMSSYPPTEGTDCLVAFLGGNREQGMIIVAENRKFRIKGLEQGEVAIFDDLGNVVHLQREQVLVKAVTKAKVVAPVIEAESLTQAKISAGQSSIDITPSGVAINSPRLTHNGRNIGATHTHSGVQIGSASTGMPNP